MLDVLQFIFSSFWVFCGSLLLLGVMFEGIEGCIDRIAKAIKDED